jgi:monooxygenase
MLTSRRLYNDWTRVRRAVLVAQARALLVIDTIGSFTETGIALSSGEVIEADVVVAATGFDLSVFGEIAFTAVGSRVDFVKYRV